LNQIIVKPITIPIADTVGEHCILELYACDCAKLGDEDFVRAAINNAARRVVAPCST